MNTFQLATFVALAGSTALGVFVYFGASGRRSNQGFAVLSAAMTLWLTCVLLGSTAVTVQELEFWIRAACIAGIFIPFGLDFLRASIVLRDAHSASLKKRILFWLLPIVGLAGLVQTRMFLVSAALPAWGETVAVPKYGPAYPIYASWFVAATAYVAYTMVMSLRRATGIQRIELQFIMMGTLSSLPVAASFVAVSKLLGSPEIGRFLPLTVLVIDGFIAYGIATKRIMGVPYILHRIAAYATLSVYLGSIYAIWWFACERTLRLAQVPRSAAYANFVATLAVALSLLAARGWTQKMARRLFLGRPVLSLEEVVEKASRILQFVTRVDLLLPQIAALIERTFESGSVRFLLPDETGRHFVQRHPSSEEGPPLTIPDHSPVVRGLRSVSEPILPDLLDRGSPTALEIEAAIELSELDAAVAVGSRAKTALQGIMLLGPKPTRQIYDAMEQRTLQVISDQLAVALANARLYTELQDSLSYNDLIVESLAGGLIVEDQNGVLTVLNRRAEQILGVTGSSLVGKSLSALPPALAGALQETLQTRVGIHDRDMKVKRSDQEITPVRVSSSVIRGHRGDVRGALLLVSDMTTIKRLEDQVRRTDRLSSLGTLSAGMAHEIKNPLVTIKTFTQLLPERHEDAEFRDTFFNLIGTEVMRIDSIVNRLLGFARPAKPEFLVISLHDAIEDSLQLVQEQAKSKGIKLVREFNSTTDLVNGDGELLKQAFVNFFLNAVQSMDDGGQLVVGTERVDPPRFGSGPRPGRHAHLHVSIRDTGAGIREEDVNRVFDPFFTTKAEGTGLGLSVAHGILQEHTVGIDVDSQVGVGTTFHLTFPLVATEEAEV